MKLILAESNLDDAQLISSRMTENGFWEIGLAQSTSECLELLEQEPADLLLLDAELPGLDSFELLERVKHRHPKLPVIMLMPPGAEAELDGTRAMHHRAQSYVTKSPGWESRLPLMVERWQQGARAQEQVERTASELSFLRQHYQTLLAYTREAVLALNPAGVIVHFSPAAERLLGYSTEEAVGKQISMLYESPEAIRGILTALAEPGKDIRADDLAHLPGILRVIPPTQGEEREDTIRYETFLRHRDGHFLIFEVTTTAVRDEEGELTGYLTFCRELTEERQAQRELLRTKALLQTILDTVPINILILGATGNIAAANKNVERSLGYIVRELIGEQATKLAAEPDQVKKLQEAFQRTLETGEPQQFTSKLRDTAGEARDHQVFTALMRNSQGEITGIIVITTDLSGHKQEIEALGAEIEQVQADERKARALFETAATIADADDLYGVFANIAESAVAHLNFDQVTVYRADHEQGLLVGVVTADAEGGLVSCSPCDRVRPHAVSQSPGQGASEGGPVPGDRAAVAETQIKLAAGEDPLADFALGSEPHRLLPTDLSYLTNDKGRSPLMEGPHEAPASAGDEAGPAVAPRAELLVQMRTPGDDGTLVGVIRARNAVEGTTGEPRPITSRQINLLCSMARLGSVANERARMERLRNQLISSVSHELRTPLAAIRAYNELLLDGDAGPINDEQRLFLSRIEVTSLQLTRILNDLLDLSRMRAGELSIRKVHTDVAAIIQYIINTVQPEATKRDVTLRTRVQPDLPAIVTDADRLSQVLVNLVDNAIKYGDKGGSVLVEAKVDESDLVISVADDGPGIPPDDLGKIFDEFHRGRQDAQHKARGAGLGLPIVSRLTRLLGGSVSVDSTVGEGSTFHLRFPLAHLTANQAQ